MAHQFPTRCGGLRLSLRIVGGAARDGFANRRRNVAIIGGRGVHLGIACAGDLLNIDGPRVLGNGWASAVHQEDRSRVQEEWKSAVRSGDRWRKPIRRAAGSRKCKRGPIPFPTDRASLARCGGWRIDGGCSHLRT